MIRAGGRTENYIRAGGTWQPLESPTYQGTILDAKTVTVNESGEIDVNIFTGPGEFIAVAAARDTE